MPRPIKKRAVKKIKAEEEVIDMYERAKAYYEEKTRNVQIAIVAFLVILAVSLSVFVYLRNTSSDALEVNAKAYSTYVAAVSQNDRKLFNESLEQFKESFEIRKSPVPMYYQGDIYQRLGDTEKAVETLLTLTDMFSSDEFILPLAYAKLGMIYIQQGNYEKALKIFGDMEGRSLKAYGDFAVYQMGNIHKKTGDEEGAEKQYRRLVELFPTSPYAREVEGLLDAVKEEITVEQDQRKPEGNESGKE